MMVEDEYAREVREAASKYVSEVAEISNKHGGTSALPILVDTLKRGITTGANPPHVRSATSILLEEAKRVIDDTKNNDARIADLNEKIAERKRLVDTYETSVLKVELELDALEDELAALKNKAGVQ